MARKILLADDSVTAQNMGRKILADAGYDVITVNNGSAALKRITEVRPDLIVLDVYMPGYSGLEVCQRIKDADETEHIPVLLTVGKLEPFKPEEARRVRADGHIVKPFEASELLTAITRLEDRMVPQQSDGGRFSPSVSGVERFGGGDGRKTENGGDADTGWKSRLRFPSKKKKEEAEPEPEDIAAATPFRDFRKAKGKAGANAPFAVKAPAPPGQEPGLVPDIPRDITPDELDALSALAAKLDGPIPAAENIVPLAEAAPATSAAADQAKPSAPAVDAPSKEVEVASEVPKTYAEIVASAEARKQKEEKQKEDKIEVETPVAASKSAEASVDAPPAAMAAKSETETPATQVDLAASAAPVPEAATTEAAHPETTPAAIPEPHTQQAESQPAEFSVAAVNTGLLAQDPAPVDQNDEPMFNSAAIAVPPAAITSERASLDQASPDQASTDANEKSEQKPPEALSREKTDASTAEAIAIAKPEETRTEPSKKTEEAPAAAGQSEKSFTQDLKAEAAQPAPVAASAPVTADAEDLSPSEAELAQALRLLTPAGGNADAATIPSHGTLIAAGQLLAEEALRNASSGPRWFALPVALTPEDAAISLEAEMFRAFMTVPPAALSSLEPSRMTGVSAIEAAVENRLAAVELAASAKASSEQTPAEGSSARLPEPATVEAPTEAAKANASESSQRPEPIGAPNIDAEKIESEKIKAESSEAAKPETGTPEKEAKDSSAEVAEQSPVAATVETSQLKIESAAQPAEQQISNTDAATAAVSTEEDRESSSEVGSEESMAKDNKSKSGKSNWHQIRTATNGGATNGDALEAAKQAESGADESPKAMAAAASESASAAAPDASTIASIVDSVMADLRPKIVEEIAKKLSGK
ncbi:MAG: response regulator [Terriglobales bacterium]